MNFFPDLGWVSCPPIRFSSFIKPRNGLFSTNPLLLASPLHPSFLCTPHHTLLEVHFLYGEKPPIQPVLAGEWRYQFDWPIHNFAGTLDTSKVISRPFGFVPGPPFPCEPGQPGRLPKACCGGKGLKKKHSREQKIYQRAAILRISVKLLVI